MGWVLFGQALFCLLIFCSKVYLSLAFSPLEVLIQTMFLHFLLTGIFFLFIIPTALLFIHFTVSFITFSLCLSSLLTHFCFHISAGELTDGHSLMSQDLLLYPGSHVICKIFSFLSYAPLKHHPIFRPVRFQVYALQLFWHALFFLRGSDKCCVHFRELLPGNN